MDLLGGDLHEGDDAAAVLLLDVDHALEQGVARVDQVVAEQDREGLVADVRGGAQHGVAEALGVALADVVDHGEVAGFLDLGQPARVTLLLEGGLELVVAVEVVLEGRLLRPVTMRTSPRPADTASSTTYWIAGLSTTGSISLGVALVAGRNRVPRPAAGMTALLILGWD